MVGPGRVLDWHVDLLLHHVSFPLSLAVPKPELQVLATFLSLKTHPTQVRFGDSRFGSETRDSACLKKSVPTTQSTCGSPRLVNSGTGTVYQETPESGGSILSSHHLEKRFGRKLASLLAAQPPHLSKGTTLNCPFSKLLTHLLLLHFVSSSFRQQPHSFKVAVLSCNVQSCLSILACFMYVSISFQQKQHNTTSQLPFLTALNQAVGPSPAQL